MGKNTRLGQKFLLALLTVYRYSISPLLGQCCRFYPSCSVYAQEAIRTCGVWRGTWLVVKRLACCHPWHPGGYDPVPVKPSIH